MSNDQPLPISGRRPVLARVIADLEARTQKGIETYGRPLETFNGRSSLIDLGQELADALQYITQLLMEQESPLSREELAMVGIAAAGICLQVNDTGTVKHFETIVNAVLAAAWPTVQQEKTEAMIEAACYRATVRSILVVLSNGGPVDEIRALAENALTLYGYSIPATRACAPPEAPEPEPRRGEYEVPEDSEIEECRSCNAQVVWGLTKNRRAIPLSIATIVRRNGKAYALSHFADCPHARDWSRKK